MPSAERASQRVQREEKLANELRRIVPLLIEIGVSKVILFGSLARHEIEKDSDIDLLVVWQTRLPFLERLDVLYRKLLPTVSLDLICYTPEEFNELKVKNPFVERIAREGVVLYAAPVR
ncbi:MAG: uncharacterized protein PWQ41_1859 [Bacillota bacterium]|jgi:predicted nucleotidyltransferase|nr:uncharacterized protein [Bacillota bacterium]